MNRPRLAMLVPAYNAAQFLPRLMASAAAQKEPFDDIWVYDDCSTDDTAEVARSLGARVLSGTVNKGCSAGKNALAAKVDAEWLHFHDADDELLPNFVTLARRWIAVDQHDVVLFNYEERDDTTGGHIAMRKFDPGGIEKDIRSYAVLNQINAICGLYRRSSILLAGGYDVNPAVLYNEDVAFHLRLAAVNLRFGVETNVSIINNRRMNSMSASNGAKCARAQYCVMRSISESTAYQPYGKEIASRLWNISAVLAAYRDFPAAIEAAQLATRLAPVSKTSGSAPFRLLAQMSPALAIKAREFTIRTLRPGLRKGYP